MSSTNNQNQQSGNTSTKIVGARSGGAGGDLFDEDVAFYNDENFVEQQNEDEQSGCLSESGNNATAANGGVGGPAVAIQIINRNNQQ
jgi:hypothetical protein